MTLESFYLTCFLVGFLLSFVSFLAQAGHLHFGDGAQGVDAGGHHGHFHIDHGGDHGGGDGEQQNAGVVSRFNFSTLTAFLAWFGGSGYLLTRFTSIWSILALLCAATMGIAGAWIVFSFLAKLVERDRTLDPADFDMVGVLGHVSSTVRRGGVGEIIFTQDGIRRSAPVRSDDGGEIAKGEEVVVTRYERGVGYVRRWTEL